MKLTLTAATSLALLSTVCAAGDELELKTENDKVNYSVGYQIGGDFKRQEVELNPEAVVKGIEDALSGAEPLMTPAEMQATLIALKKRIMQAQQQKMIEAAADNLKAANAFLAENANKEGVTTLDSGLQYKVIASGNGKSPQKSDEVTVHYRGTLVDGSEFDSSHSRGKPATFGVGDVIPGWTEALQLMKEGGKWELYVPPKLGYGALGGGKIPPNSALIFEVELISVN
jgi:FKBP-type peptidyl-prolyl cis-trans isomerase FklB